MHDIGYRELAVAILFQAIEDWRSFPDMHEDILCDLQSDWGEFLCDHIGLNHAELIDKLENDQIPKEGPHRPAIKVTIT